MLGHRSVVLFNVLALLAIAAVLAAAFAYQLALHELPCPLCNLQRAAFVALAAGPALNICLGVRPRHYALTLFAGLLGALVAGRQTLLHILPGDTGYGNAVFGLHLYAWAFIIFVAAISLTALALFLGQTREASAPAEGKARWAVGLVLLMAALNFGSVVLACGGDVCPDDPAAYKLLVR